MKLLLSRGINFNECCCYRIIFEMLDYERRSGLKTLKYLLSIGLKFKNIYIRYCCFDNLKTLKYITFLKTQGVQIYNGEYKSYINVRQSLYKKIALNYKFNNVIIYI